MSCEHDGQEQHGRLQVRPLSIKRKVPSSQAGFSQTGLPSVLLTPSQRSLWGIIVGLAAVCQSKWLDFSKLGLTLEFERALVLHGRCEPVGEVCAPTLCWPVLLGDSGAHTHLRVSGTDVSCTPLPLRSLFYPLLPLLGWFFSSYQLFPVFFSSLLAHTHAQSIVYFSSCSFCSLCLQIFISILY